jgi:hypothetical protein
MRNYCKFWLSSGHYDDGFGGSVILTNFFDNEGQRDLYFDNLVLPNPMVFNIDGPVWPLLNKEVFEILLNQAYGATELSPSYIVPPIFASFSPRKTWDSQNQYFVKAQPFPAWV